jgi:hypothetical protein
MMTRTAQLIGVIIVVIVLGVVFFMWKSVARTTPVENPPVLTTPVSGTNGGTQASTTGPVEPPTGSTSYAYGTVKLSVGQTAIFSDISLSPSSIEDSRCPTGDTCIQAGTAKVLFVTITNSGTKNQSLSIGQQVTVDGIKIVLQSVDPYPIANKTTAQSMYVMTFSVTK